MSTLAYSKKIISDECAVSEVFGQVLLTVIVVILMASIGMFVLSEPKPPEVPHIDIYEQLDPFTDTVVIRNNGGESVPLRDFKLVLHSGSTEYVINGEELSGYLIEECGDNGYWDLSEHISINVLEVCGLDLGSSDEDLKVLLIHTPSKKVIHSSLIPSIYLDDTIQSPNDRISEEDSEEDPEEEEEDSEEEEEEDSEEDSEESDIISEDLWIPPQLLACDNSVRPQSGNKPDLIGSACLDDVQNIGDNFTTYYPNEAVSMSEYFEFGLNESVLDSFGVTFSDYENLTISGAKIKVVYKGHDGSFKWLNLSVWDQTEGIFYEYPIPEYHSGKGKSEWGSEIVDLPHITNVEDIENLNVYMLAKANPGQSAQHDIHIDYIAVYIPCSGEESTTQNNPPVADAGGPYSTQVCHSVTFDGSNSNDPDGDTIAYLWNFGDGSTGSGVAPEHSYSAFGTYSVTLNVTDDKSATDTDVVTVVVTEAPQENLIYIGNVIVTTSKHGSDVTATAVVTILDNNNNPVKDAEVSGYWSGAASGNESEETGNDGTVTVYSNSVFHNVHTGTLTFTFTVNGVTHPSYTWDNITKSGTAVYP